MLEEPQPIGPRNARQVAGEEQLGQVLDSPAGQSRVLQPHEVDQDQLKAARAFGPLTDEEVAEVQIQMVQAGRVEFADNVGEPLRELSPQALYHRHNDTLARRAAA